jgi:hypothetical protein
MQVGVMVKNTFLEFDVKNSTWQKESCRRRASAGAIFAGGEWACQKDDCEIDTDSTIGSDRLSPFASSEPDSAVEVDLDDEAEVVHNFYSSECDDWDSPYPMDNMPEPDVNQICSTLGLFRTGLAPQETIQQRRFDLDTSMACSQSHATYFSTTPNQSSACNVAMMNTSENGSQSPIEKQRFGCYIEQPLTDYQNKEHLSLSPSRKQNALMNTQSCYAQSPFESRTNDSLSQSPRRKQKGGWGAESRFSQASFELANDSLSQSPRRKQKGGWTAESRFSQVSCEPRQHESQSQSPCRKRMSPQNTSSNLGVESDYTTVMLRNLPNDYTRDMLVDLLRSKGFGSSYDFLYLPFDFKRSSGLGYAFVNMTTHEEALRVMRILAGFHSWKLRSGKVLQVTWSTPLQGLSANIERYRNSPVMHPDVPEQFKPLLLSKGRIVAFPSPTRALPMLN